MRKYLVTIGTFDGIHLGHRRLMRWVLRRAKRLGLGTRVVLFSRPPRFHFRPDLAVPLLTTSDDRRRMLRGLGIERVEVLEFGPRWANMPHTRFFSEYLVGRWRAGGVLVGRDFAFGKGRKGDVAYLRKAGARTGLSVGVLPLLQVSGRKISSSRIRELLERGEVESAAALLGRPHSVSGRVVRGAGLGAKLGFPTANVDFPAEVLVPRGVYHARLSAAGLGRRDAACNVGTRPTLGAASKLVCEVHVPGLSKSLYGRVVKVEFLRRIRPERRFASLDDLKAQIARDVRVVINS